MNENFPLTDLIVNSIFRLWIEEQWKNILNVAGEVIDMCWIEYDALGD